MSRSGVKSIILVACILFNLGIGETVFCAQKKATDNKKTTYPDVWGIELPLPDKDIESTMPSTIYEDENGDIVVEYMISYENLYHVRLVSFFSGKLVYEFFYTSEKQVSKETRKFMKTLKKLKKISSGSSPIIFGDGSKLIENSFYLGRAHPADYWVEKFDKNGRKIFSRVYLMKSEKTFKASIRSESDLSEGSDDGPVLVHILPLYFHAFWKLKDGTYILEQDRKTVLIRFREDLSSPYVENNKNFLILDTDKYEKKYMEIYDDVLTEPQIKKQSLPVGAKEGLWKDTCRSRLECFDKKLSDFFDEEQNKKQGGKE